MSAVDTTGDLVVVRRCADTAEVLAAGLAGLGTVAVIDAEMGVDRALVARLRTTGTLTVVVCEAADVGRYGGLGAHALARTAEAGPVLAAIRHALADGVPAVAMSDEVPVVDVAAVPEVSRGGLVVVTGPHGSPGRTTVAVNLAAEIAAAGQSVLLVDGDVWGASLAPVLGVLEESAGVAAAVRAADQGTLDAAALGRLCLQVSDRLTLLPGLPRAARWREVASVSLETVWERAREVAAWVVVDGGTRVPDDDDTGFDAVLGPRRNAVLDSALATAEEVVVVGAAEPLGVQRLVQSLLEDSDLATEAGTERPGRRHVVLTRVRASAAGPRPGDSVVEALARFASVTDPVLVADDRLACDRAALSGGTLAEVAPRSPAREALRAFAMHVIGAPSPRRRRGLGRVLRRSDDRSPAHGPASEPPASGDAATADPVTPPAPVAPASRPGTLPAGYGPAASSGASAAASADTVRPRPPAEDLTRPSTRRARREDGGDAADGDAAGGVLP